MGKEKIAFIINLKAGKRRKPDLEKVIHESLDREQLVPSIFITRYAGHAHELTKELIKEGFKKIVAVGGDGTVNEIASALVERKVSLGIIPMGSGNGLAFHLNIPNQLQRAIQIINRGKSKKIDAGRVNDHWFFCTCGVGFDARIGHVFAESSKRGFLTYVKAVIKEYKQYRPKKYSLRIDGIKLKRRAFLITIANSGQYGNNAYIAPNALINDGLFDVCIVKPFPKLKLVSLMSKMMRRSIDQSEYHEVFRARTIQFKKKKEYQFHFDGEPVVFQKRKIRISVHPKKLRVIVP